jgi:osmotically-inducible protein OsmY
MATAGVRVTGRSDLEDRARDAGEFVRRTGRKVANWFNDLGQDDRGDVPRDRGARGVGPKGYKRSDERISDEVHQRLTDDPWLDASDIGVSVSGGEVTLSGTVESREAKHRAERIVEDLSGVQHVQNNLRCKSGNYFTSAGRGYGDSVQAAQMREPDPVKDVTDGGTGSATRKPS